MRNEKKRVTILSVFAALFLTGFKLFIGIVTGSLGILSEALHSGLDLVAALITYFSVRISDKPADKEHHYGHGKIENLSALFETFLLLITCVWIIYEASSRLISGETQIEVNTWSYIVVISSIIIDISRSRALNRVAKKYNSQALEADALHFSTDILSSLVVLTGLIISRLGYFMADAIAALLVGVIVIIISIRLGKKSIDVLLDKAPAQTVIRIQETLAGIPEVKYYHSLKVRTSGADTFIKVNIHLDPDLKLKQVHQLCDSIEKRIGLMIPRSEVFIHAEPQTKKHLRDETSTG